MGMTSLNGFGAALSCSGFYYSGTIGDGIGLDPGNGFYSVSILKEFSCNKFGIQSVI